MQIKSIKYHYPEQHVDINNENVRDHAAHLRFVGTKTLYKAKKTQTASDLGLIAANDLLVNVDPISIDFLIFSSLTLDYNTPTTASILHQALGLSQTCGVMDLPYGCAGFPMALMIANGLFNSLGLKNVLVVLAEVPSQAVHPNDESLKWLFGDAGVAVLLAPSGDQPVFDFGNDGNGFNYLNVLRGGAKLPFDKEFLESNALTPNLNQYGQIHMDGQGILKMTLTHIPEAIHRTLNRAKLSHEQIDHYIFHQASNIILEALQRKLAIPEGKMINYIADGGNTVSCTIPIAWAKAIEEHRFKNEDKVLLVGFGVGFSWCSALVTYQS